MFFKGSYNAYELRYGRRYRRGYLKLIYLLWVTVLDLSQDVGLRDRHLASLSINDTFTFRLLSRAGYGTPDPTMIIAGGILRFYEQDLGMQVGRQKPALCYEEWIN